MKIFEHIYRLNEVKYIQKLFDIAEERKPSQIHGSGWIGYSDNLDDENSIIWIYWQCRHNDDKLEKYGGAEIEFFNCMKSDKYGNLLPAKLQRQGQQKDKPKDENGNYQIGPVPFYMSFDEEEPVLFVPMGSDYKRDKYGNIKYQGPKNDRYPVYIDTGPKGSSGAYERRLAAKEKIRLEKEKEERWNNRGTLYSPWSDNWLSKEQPEFKKELKKFLNWQFTGHPEDKGDFSSLEDVYSTAKDLDVDIDALDQYLSQVRDSTNEAFRNSRFNNN